MTDIYPDKQGVELTRRGQVSDPSLRHMLGAAAATALVIFSLPVAAAGIEKVHPAQTETQQEAQRSRIVGGVWSLVLSHHLPDSCTQPTAELLASCESTGSNGPHLLIEQCHRDVAMARRNLSTVSFDGRLQELSPGCYDDLVLVSDETWQEFDNGTKIKLPGTLEQHLTK